ncbi:prepilin peptidase [Bacillus massiliigorillae]|uniref:prepilin peptidase n=1 Tax=Bacillus massiliigorillae TaxID=1243664 RepID=UPI0003A991C9|nr:A24 family peptidase [Bacillus massiliigorillae]
MELLIILYLAVVGLVFGSFFNVVGLRVPLKQSIVRPRSSCPNCKHMLTSKELIPVVSYIIQGGKCRSCKAPISPIYPIMEFVTGFLFAITPLIIGWSNELLIAYSLISLLVIITVSDLAYMIIPDKVLLFFAALFLILHIYPGGLHIIDSLLGALVGFGILLLIALISNGGMGGGDIKLFAVLGLILGVKLIILTLFFSALYGALLGSLFIVIGVAKKKQPIPFGPYIALATLTAYFFGERIVNWYFGVLL